MNFFTYAYFVNQVNSSQNFKYIIATIFAVILVGLAFQISRHRDDNKYRDLIIIVALCGVLLLGIQFTNYQQSQSTTNQNQRTVEFLKSVCKEKKVKSSDVACSQTALTNQMVLKIKNEYYQVIFNSDFSSYQLAKASLINNQINLISK